jgi:hypothetical protein
MKDAPMDLGDTERPNAPTSALALHQKRATAVAAHML